MCREDVMQEAYLVYRRVVVKYPGLEAPHLMALFKRAWANQFTNLTNLDSEKQRELVSSEDMDPGLESASDLDNDGYLRVLLGQAPTEIKQVLKLFLSAPMEVYSLFFDVNQREYNCYKNRNRAINRMLGLDSNRDIMGEVKEYLS
jgi:hypothetical protein